MVAMKEIEPTETEKLIKREYELSQYQGEFEVLPASELRKIARGRPRPSVLLKSGIPAIDATIEGFEPPELTIITGPTKGGKTLFCQTLTESFIRQGFNLLWFPYENCGEYGERFMRAFGAEVPEFFMPKKLKRNALEWLNERIWETQVKYNHVHAVFIDHLHFLFDMARSKSPSLEIGAIMRQLIGIAQERNVAMFLICHMVKVAPDHEPQAGDTRDSGMIECECDNLLAVWRSKKQGSTQSKIKVILNRRLGVFDYVVTVAKQGPYLREIEQRQQEAPQSWENKCYQ
ncbi:hypothetical protein C4571_02005 [Candidatus Parcubacteria bacterium]|nr:MAG: hypothetical protein C4571_02005 [Candidatus Parcubacteria bacterium]